MELSEEMKEVVRILREDGQIGAYNKMSESNRALVERLDQMETKNSERDARWEEKFGKAGGDGDAGTGGTGPEGTENGGGSQGGNPGGDQGAPGSDGVPTPPPVKQDEPPAGDEGKPKRKRWYESDVYSKGD